MNINSSTPNNEEEPILNSSIVQAEPEATTQNEIQTPEILNDTPNVLLPIDIHPQQNVFTFENIVISSQFDSGNLARCVNITKNCFNMYISEDSLPYMENAGNYRTWFYFNTTGVKKGEILTFSVRNMNNQGKLYKSGLKPVFRIKQQNQVTTKWKRVPTNITYDYGNEGFHITFSHQFNGDASDQVYFAFTYPYSFEDSLKKTQKLMTKLYQHETIYFHREVLALSEEKREMEILTLTGYENITTTREDVIQNLFPQHQVEGDDAYKRPFKFDKPTIFLTSRVHPGETPASYVLNGIIDFLVNEKSEQAKILRENFVFKIIPMLNPDGVYRGYFRLDTRGQNLNRFYTNPTMEHQPTIYAAKEAIVQQHNDGKLFVYSDIHAHASKMGCFMFGNCLNGEAQLQNMMLPKLISMNCLNFDFIECGFSEKMMNVKDKKDGLSREGCGRVAIHKETQLPHCYTLECNYASGRRINHLPPKFNKASGLAEPETSQVTDMHSRMYTKNKAPNYNVEIFEDVGRAFCIGLLDYIDKNPVSRINMSTYKTVENVKNDILAHYPIIIPKKQANTQEGANQKQQPLKQQQQQSFKQVQRTYTTKNSKSGSRSSINTTIKTKNIPTDNNINKMQISTTGEHPHKSASKGENKENDSQLQKQPSIKLVLVGGHDVDNFGEKEEQVTLNQKIVEKQINWQSTATFDDSNNQQFQLPLNSNQIVSQQKLIRNISEKRNKIGQTIFQKRNQTLTMNENKLTVLQEGLNQRTATNQQLAVTSIESMLLLSDEKTQSNNSRSQNKPIVSLVNKGSTNSVEQQQFRRKQFMQLLNGAGGLANNKQHYQTEQKQVTPITVFRMPTPTQNQKSSTGLYSMSNAVKVSGHFYESAAASKDSASKQPPLQSINNKEMMQMQLLPQILEGQTGLLIGSAAAKITTLLGNQYFNRRGGSKEQKKQQNVSSSRQRIQSEGAVPGGHRFVKNQNQNQNASGAINAISKNCSHQNMLSPKFVREGYLQRHVAAANASQEQYIKNSDSGAAALSDQQYQQSAMLAMEAE